MGGAKQRRQDRRLRETLELGRDAVEKIAAAETRVEQTTKQVQETLEREVELQRRLGATEKQLTEARSGQITAERAIEVAHGQLRDANQVCSRLSAELEVLRTRVPELEQRLAAVAGLDLEAAPLRRRLAAKSEELRQLQVEYNKLKHGVAQQLKAEAEGQDLATSVKQIAQATQQRAAARITHVENPAHICDDPNCSGQHEVKPG